MSGRRAHSPLPPPREPRGPMYEAMRERGGGGPPPPPGPPGGGRRRPRDDSPPGGYRRGSPPPYGPYGGGGGGPKRSRRDDEYHDRYDRSPPRHRGGRDYPPYDERDDYYRGGPGGPYDHPYGQPPPPPREHRGPMSFRQFLNRLSDDVTPEEAQRLYDEYLIDSLGDLVEAEWHKTRKNAGVRERFHPAAFEERLTRRRADAAEAAAAMISDLEAGRLDPESETFNQGAGESAAAAAAAAAAPGGAGEEQRGEPRRSEGGSGGGAAPAVPPPPPPALLWAPERAAADLRAAMRLAAILDEEKGIQSNPLLPEAPAAAEDEQAAAGGDGDGDAAAAGAQPDAAGDGDGGAAAAAGGDAAMASVDSGAAAGDAAAADAGGGCAGGGAVHSKRLTALLAAMEDAAPAAPAAGDEAALRRLLGRLDLLLTWLWRVHGADYYGGRELLGDDEWARRGGGGRCLRGPRPEEGEGVDEERAKKDAERLSKSVDEFWAARIAEGDPVLRGCMRDEAERRVEAWIESQIFKQADSKWGNKLSAKFFLEKKFVVKHIRNKHAEKLEAARQEILDAIAHDRFREVRGAELRQQQQERAAARAAAAAAAGPLPYGGAPPDWAGGGGRGGGRGFGGPGGIPLIDPSVMMGGAPVIIPLGALGAPGGIMPLGGGIIPLGGVDGGGYGGRGRGGRGGRGVGGRGGGGGWAPGGGYVDLDHPANNRAVLDYGDI